MPRNCFDKTGLDISWTGFDGPVSKCMTLCPCLKRQPKMDKQRLRPSLTCVFLHFYRTQGARHTTSSGQRIQQRRSSSPASVDLSNIMIGRFPFIPFRSPWPNQQKHQPVSKPVDISSKLATEAVCSMSEILHSDVITVGVSVASHIQFTSSLI